MLKAKHSKLGQDGVTNNSLCLGIWQPQLFKRCRRVQDFSQMIQRCILLLGLLILDNRMTMGKCTTLRILPGQSDVITLEQKCAKGHSFGSSPINIHTRLSHFLTSFEDLYHLSVKFESLWNFSSLHANVTKDINIYTGWSKTTVLPRRLKSSPSRT